MKLTKGNSFIYILFLIILMVSCDNGSNGDGGDDTVANSCEQVFSASFTVGASTINVTFQRPANVNSVRVEFGETGFALGTGTSSTTSETQFEISDLFPDTTYDVYVFSVCSAQDQSDPVGLLSITTDPPECGPGGPQLTVSQTSLNSIDLTYNMVGVQGETFEIEYGLSGFELGTGTQVTTASINYSVTQFDPETAYTFYVRALCSANDISSYTIRQITTAPACPSPEELQVFYVNGSCNNANIQYRFEWEYYYDNVTNFTLALPHLGDPPSSGTMYHTSNTTINIAGFSCATREAYVRTNCDDGTSSEWHGPVIFN